VVPLATEAGLRDALNVRLPPALEPLASCTRTGKMELLKWHLGSPLLPADCAGRPCP